MCLASVADHSRALARVSVFGCAEEWQLWAGAAGRQEGQIPGKINKRESNIKKELVCSFHQLSSSSSIEAALPSHILLYHLCLRLKSPECLEVLL